MDEREMGKGRQFLVKGRACQNCSGFNCSILNCVYFCFGLGGFLCLLFVISL